MFTIFPRRSFALSGLSSVFGWHFFRGFTPPAKNLDAFGTKTVKDERVDGKQTPRLFKIPLHATTKR
jgi:hypothetical protein